MFAKPLIALSATCALLLAAACGDHSAGGAGSAAAPPVAGQGHKSKAPSLDDDLVRAASPSKTGAALDMKFKLGSKPTAGNVVPLTLVFQPPAEDMDRMTVSLSASDGLSIEAGEGPATFVPSHGASITHEMSVKADHDGIFFVTASVLVDGLNNTSSSRSFSVPIIVGEGIPAAVPKASGGISRDSGGERVKSLPARPQAAAQGR